MRPIVFLLLLGIAASAWAAHIFLGGLAEDEEMIIRREFAENVQSLEVQANSGVAEVQTELGLLYLTAHELVRDPVAAVEWFGRAARQGEPRAQYLLGRQYEDGVGFKRDYKQAARWYERAAKIGRYPDAEYALGSLYSRGLGVPNNNAAAMDWYQKAAMGGQPVGQYLVGRMYESGYGVREDLIQSYFWYSLSARARDRVMAENTEYDPARALKRVSSLMNQSQRDAAVKLVKQWKPTH